MTASNNQNNDQRIEIELIKRDVMMISKLCEKFDMTIDKLQQVAGDLSRIMSLQEQKIISQDKINNEVESSVKRLDSEHRSDSKDLHNKIDLLEESILAEMKKTHDGLTAKIADIEKWRYGVMAVIAALIVFADNILEVFKIL